MNENSECKIQKMGVNQVAATMTVSAKQCYACANSEIQAKTEIVLLQANIH